METAFSIIIKIMGNETLFKNYLPTFSTHTLELENSGRRKRFNIDYPASPLDTYGFSM